jgi:hypothetical protein
MPALRSSQTLAGPRAIAISARSRAVAEGSMSPAAVKATP